MSEYVYFYNLRYINKHTYVIIVLCNLILKSSIAHHFINKLFLLIISMPIVGRYIMNFINCTSIFNINFILFY